MGIVGASFVKVEILLGPAHDCLVALVEVLLRDHVSILADCLHARLLADAGDVGRADLVRSAHVLLQVHVLGEVHLGGDCLEDQTFLAAVGQGELDFPVQSTGPEQSGIEGVCSVGGHDDLYIDVLLEAVHLVQQLNQHSLHLAISSSLGIETPE